MKRFFDVLIAVLSLLICAPLLLSLAVVIRVTLGSPCFFVQRRPGLNGKPFNLIKFRSMKNVYDLDGNPLPDEKRLNRFGRFLRASSLDELPELFNVLKGEMSIVGPRPLLEEYLDLYSPMQARRHEVRPGITGWAQVNGRNTISWEQKFELDVWYIDNWSLMLDVKILFLTIAKAMSAEGVQQEGHATAEKFKGSVNDDKG